MCDTNVYVVSAGREEMLLESADLVRQEGGEVYAKNLFGEEKRVKGRIAAIELRKHRIVIETA